MIMLDDVPCPEPNCDLPAEIVERVILNCVGPDGPEPVEHVRIECITHTHWFLIPVHLLDHRLD
jgi:hypothetical protein